MGRKQKCCHEIKWSLQMKWQHFAQQSKHAQLHHQQKLIWNLKMFPWKGNHLHIINFGVPCYFAGGSMTTLSWMEVSRCESFCWTRHRSRRHFCIFYIIMLALIIWSLLLAAVKLAQPPSLTGHQLHLLQVGDGISIFHPTRSCIFPVPKIIKSIATQ